MAMAALIMAALMVFVGLTVDLGLGFFEKRRLQAATDAAAIAAAQNPANAQTIATNVLAANGFPDAVITKLTLGTYTPNPAISPSQRFVANGASANAVSISTKWNSPIYFARVLVAQNNLSLNVSAMGTMTNMAGLVAGSGLVSINNGLLNSVLGGLLGTTVNLTAVQYQGLANANVNALDFLNALAGQLHITTGTYSQVMNSTVSVGSVISAAISALSTEGQLGATQATLLQSLQLLQSEVPSTALINVGQLINAGTWQTAQVGSIASSSALDANINLFQLLSFSSQLANGSNFLNVPTSFDVPGVATVTMAMTLIEPQQGSYYELGPVGLTVHTSQLRLRLTMNLLSGLSIPPALTGSVQLPLYIEVADGNASVTSISCGTSPASDTVVTVAAQSGIANAYVGTVSNAAMTNVTQPVTVGPATIANLSLLNIPVATVTGSSHVPLQGTVQTLSFTEQQIQALTSQSVVSNSITSNLLQSLVTQTNLNVSLLGGTPLPVGNNQVTAAVATALQPAAAVVDSVVDGVLRSLGIRLGYLDVTVPGARCGVAALSQ